MEVVIVDVAVTVAVVFTKDVVVETVEEPVAVAVWLT